MKQRSRREFMAEAGIGMTAVASTSVDAAVNVAPESQPKDVGRKFEADGRVRPFAGNTIIAHLPQQGSGFETFDRLLNIYRDLPSYSFARKVTMLPTSSYHMTIFNGANDQGRSQEPWPIDVPENASIEHCTDLLQDRLSRTHFASAVPFRMIAEDKFPARLTSPITLHLRPADDQENRKLRILRDQISDVLKMRAADHDTYKFHITIAYQVAPFTAADSSNYAFAMDKWRAELKREKVIFELGAPEFCFFKDMFAFQRRSFLAA